MKAYGIHLLTKPNKYIMQEDNKHDECAVTLNCCNIQKGMHVPREMLRIGLFSLTYGTTLTSVKFNNYGTQRLKAFISFILLHYYMAYVWAPLCIWDQLLHR